MSDSPPGTPIPDFERLASDGALCRVWRAGAVPEAAPALTARA